MTTMQMSPSTVHQQCIDACYNCMKACEQCLHACLHEPDVQARIHCIQMLRDCADLCATAVQFMTRNSHHAKDVCALCASVCEMCAKDCAKFKDDHCQRCAEVCNECANACRSMIA